MTLSFFQPARTAFYNAACRSPDAQARLPVLQVATSGILFNISPTTLPTPHPALDPATGGQVPEEFMPV
jgi:hypothetical protein